jgi:hypothetical protein
VFPLLPRAANDDGAPRQPTLTGPFGEIVANTFVPRASQS